MRCPKWAPASSPFEPRDLVVSPLAYYGLFYGSSRAETIQRRHVACLSNRRSHGWVCAKCHGNAFSLTANGPTFVNRCHLCTSNDDTRPSHFTTLLNNSCSGRGLGKLQRHEVSRRPSKGDLPSFPLPDGTSSFASSNVTTDSEGSCGDTRRASDHGAFVSSSTLSEVSGLFDYNAYPVGEASPRRVKDLYIHPALQKSLAKLGISVLRPTQVSVFFLLNKGKDVLLHDRRGSGKTLALLLPIINRIYQAHDLIQSLQLHRNSCLARKHLRGEGFGLTEGHSPDGTSSAELGTVSHNEANPRESVARALYRAAVKNGWRHAALTPVELLPIKERQLQQQLRATHEINGGKHFRSSFEECFSVSNPLGLLRPVVYLVPTQDAVLSSLELLKTLDPLGRVGVQCLSEAGRGFRKQGMQQHPHHGKEETSDNGALENVSSEEWKRLGHKWRHMRLRSLDEVQLLVNKAVGSVPDIDADTTFESACSAAEQEENFRIPVIFKPRVRWGCVDIVMTTPAAYCEELHRASVEDPEPSVLVVEESDVLLQAEKQRTAMMSILAHTRPRPPVNVPHTPKKSLPAFPPTQVVFSGSTIPHGSPCSAGVMILEKFCSMAAIRALDVHVMEAQRRQLWLRLNSQKITKEYERMYPSWHSERREEELHEKMKQLNELNANRFVSESLGESQQRKEREKLRNEIEKRRRHLEEVLDDSLLSPNYRRKLFQQAAFGQRVELLLTLLRHVPLRQLVVFCNSVNSCKLLAKILTEEGWPTRTYHKHVSIKQRLQAAAHVGASLSMRDEAPCVLVATDLLARSGQLKGVPHVVNFEFPTDAVTFMHRVALCAGSVSGEEAAGGRVDNLLTHIIGPDDLPLAASLHCAGVTGSPVHAYFSRKRSLRKRAKSGAIPGHLRATHTFHSEPKLHDELSCREACSGAVVSDFGRKSLRCAPTKETTCWREGQFFGAVEWDANERNGFYAMPIAAIDSSTNICVSDETKAFRRVEMKSTETNGRVKRRACVPAEASPSEETAIRPKGRILLGNLLKSGFQATPEATSASLQQNYERVLQEGSGMDGKRSWEFWSDDEDANSPKSNSTKGPLPCDAPLASIQADPQEWTRESYKRLVIRRMKLHSSGAKPIQTNAESMRTRDLLRNFDTT